MPKERCVRKVPVHGRLWQPGEVREISDFDEKGDPIITNHFRLVEDDEDIDLSQVFDQEELKAKIKESNERDQDAAIKAALDKLDPDNPRHWTRDGRPSLQVIHQETGLTELKRADIHAAAPDFDKKSARG